MSKYATSVNISTEQNYYNPNHAVRVEHNIQERVEPRQTQTGKGKGALVTYSQQRLGLDCIHRDPLLQCNSINHLKPHLINETSNHTREWRARNENPYLKADGNGGNTNEQMDRVCANIVPRAVVLVAWVAEAGDEPGRVLHRPRRGVGDGGDDGDQARTADAAEWCRDAPAGRVGGGEEGCGEVSGGGGSGRGEQRHGGRAKAVAVAAANRSDSR